MTSPELAPHGLKGILSMVHILTRTPPLVAGRNTAERAAPSAASLMPTFCLTDCDSLALSTWPFSSTRTETTTTPSTLRRLASAGYSGLEKLTSCGGVTPGPSSTRSPGRTAGVGAGSEGAAAGAGAGSSFASGRVGGSLAWGRRGGSLAWGGGGAER